VYVSLSLIVLAGVGIDGSLQRQVCVYFMQPVLNSVSIWVHWEFVCQHCGWALTNGWQ
jgi:hypothetical protein